MSILKTKRGEKKNQIWANGLTLNFNEQLTVHQKMDKLIEKIPKDSRIELKLTKKQFYEAQIIVRGSTFGCNLKTTSDSFKSLLENIFQCANNEVCTWEKSSSCYDEFAPYFGGYPSYYREVSI